MFRVTFANCVPTVPLIPETFIGDEIPVVLLSGMLKSAVLEKVRVAGEGVPDAVNVALDPEQRTVGFGETEILGSTTVTVFVNVYGGQVPPGLYV